MDTFEIREKVSKAAAKALQHICAELGYICVFSGEIACFAYGGSRPPTNIEAVIVTPGISIESRPSNDSLKHLIADFSTDSPDGSFEMKDSTTLSFTHTRFTGQWKVMVVDVSIASTLEERDVQPICVVDGLPYACAEYVLSTRLSLWARAHNAIKRTQSTKEAQSMHRNREIDPLLRYFVKTNTNITKWRQLGVTRILEYCKSYPSSSDLWFNIGLDPKLREFTTSDSSTTTTASSGITSTNITVAGSYGPRSLPTVASSPIAEAVGVTDSSYIANGEKSPQLDDIENSSRLQLISLAAQQVVDLLQSMDIPSAIFGSLACFMYGTFRSPNDLNILLLSPPSYPPGRRLTIKLEAVEAALIQTEPEHFFLVPTKSASGQKILHYRLSVPKGPLTTVASCRVVLAYPHAYNLPDLSSSIINWDEGLPLIPFSLLLLHKLRSWDQQSESLATSNGAGKKRDAEDLKAMLELDLIEELGSRQPWFDSRLFSSACLEASAVRVRAFCSEYPEFLTKWREAGFRP